MHRLLDLGIPTWDSLGVLCLLAVNEDLIYLSLAGCKRDALPTELTAPNQIMQVNIT